MSDAPSPHRVRLTAAQGRLVRRTVSAFKGTELTPFGDTMVAMLGEPVPAVPSAVLVGEVKRGKSTLVNALAARRDLVPAGLGVVTSGFLRVVPTGDDLTEDGARLQLADGSARDVTPEQARHAILTGETGDEDESPLVGVVLVADSPWLPGLALVDTPGIAGVAAGHADLAAVAAASGSVLVLVTDAGQVLTAPELEFLERIASRLESVVFAVTKIDQYPATWPEVVAENRELLQRHAPRFADAPICPVSGSVALELIGLEGDDHADLAEYAGLGALATAVQERAVSPEGVALANALRAGLTGVERLIERRERTIATLQSGPEQLPELDALVERLRALQDQGERWSLDLQSDSSVLRADVLHRATQSLAIVRQQWTEVARERRREDPDTVTAEVAAALSLQLRAVVTATIEEFLAGFTQQAEALFASVGRRMDDCVRLEPGVDDLTLAEVAETELTGGLDPALAGTAMVGASMGGLLAGLIVPAVVAPVFTIAAGAAWYVVNYRSRRGQNLERLVTSTVVTGITRAETHLRFAVDRARTIVLRDVTIVFRQELKAALEAARSDLEVARRVATETPERRRQEIGNEERHLAALRSHRDELLVAITEAVRPRHEGAGTKPGSAVSEPVTDTGE